MTSRAAWIVRGSLALLLLPLATGVLEVTYRDAVVTHIPGKVAMVESIRAGRFPFVNPYASCGEPLAGNPNHEVFFPDAVLFLILPLPVAFGLHFAIAALLAYAGARRFARAEGASRLAAEVAGLAFVSSGVFVSAWTMYNSAMALALAPWVAAATVKLATRVREGSRARILRATAALGVVAALEVLAGEPVLALLLAVFCATRLAVECVPRSGGPRLSVKAALASALGASLIAALLSAPLLLCTWQAARGTSRDLAHFAFAGATATSVHPARLLEQMVAFPFGRPNVMGDGGFTGQAYFQGTAPYLWTLHLGWATLLLLVAFGGVKTPSERASWALAVAAGTLSLGSYLPGAHALYPVLSLGGRIRYPVKWWYLVALAVVPLVTRAVERWVAGEDPGRARRLVLLALLALGVARGGRIASGDVWQLAALGASTLAALALLATLGPGRARPGILLACIGIPAFVAMAPLLVASVVRPASSIESLPSGRLFERIEQIAHARDLPEEATRKFFRRVQREGWALTGALSGIPYAFDRDPEGSYSFHDRIVREAVDSVGWPERVAELRIAGVTHVLAIGELPEPYREREVLDQDRDVRLYDLEGAAPSVRRVGRIFRAPHFNATVAIHRSPVFDPTTDVVLPGKDAVVEGTREAGTVRVERESPDSLVAQADGAEAGVVVWARTYFPAWSATVDGKEARVLAADGHFVGVAVPAGSHRVEVVWPRAPLLLGTGLFGLGALLTLGLVKAGRRARAS